MLTVDEVQKKAKELATAGSPKDRERYMKSLHIPHRNLNYVISEARTLMTAGAGLSVTIVVGPPGVGKTTFGRMQLLNLIQQHKIEIQENPSAIPAVMCDVDAPGKDSKINYPLLYSRICKALLSPSALEGFGVPLEPNQTIDLMNNSQLMCEAAISGRGLQHLILDEAVHFAHSKSDPVQYSDMLKSYSNRSGFNLLMLGAYGCEILVLATGEMARRLSVIHYERYKDTKVDFIEYSTFVVSVAAALPYRFEVDVSKQLEYLFIGTFGLPGLTVDVLSKAAHRCVLERYPRWNDTFLLKAMPSKAAQRKIALSTVRGERDIEPYLQLTSKVNYVSEEDARRELQSEERESRSLNGRRAVR
ncbi:ATP-binding protein [Paraburkholderia azotifigens]|uniref:ATP-binding protein n=1 Tax=Paraburkholderia azotifigens TaxID=2057004 RepID=UPI00317CE598